MKKLYYLLIVLVLSFLVACGGPSEEVGSTDNQPEEPQTEEVVEEPVEEEEEMAEEEVEEEKTESEPEAMSDLSGSLEFMTGTSIDSELFLVYEELTEQFIANNPNVEIELVPSSTDHEGEIKTRLASGNVPDIWMTHGWSVGRYGDFLLPLENEPWAADLNPALEPVMISSEGHLFAFPIDLDIAGILYNGDVLAEAGFAAEDIQTWDDFMAAADAVAELGKTPIYNAGKDRWPTGLYIDWIAPGAMTNATYDAFLAGDFQAEEYSKALEMVATFRDAGYFNPDYSSATSDDISLALAQGDTAFSFLMNFVAVTGYTYNPDANIGFMPVPAFEGGEPYLISGEKNALGIHKDSENIDAALAYIAYLAEPANLERLAESTGSAAGLTTVNVELGGLTDSFELTKSTATVPYFDRVFMPNGSWDSIVSTTEGVLTNQMTIEESLAKIEEDFDALFAQQSGDEPEEEAMEESEMMAALEGDLEFMTGTSIDSELFIIYEELADEFAAKHPDVAIELVPSSTDHEGEIKTRLASGNVPDIWMTHGWSVGRYGDFLLPLENEAWAADLNPALEPVMISSEGHLFAFPIDLDIAGILYNGDVLAEAGFTPEDILTWDDFMAAADAVAELGKTPIYNAGKDRWPTGLYIDWIAPGAMTDATYDAFLAGDFQAEEYSKALEMVATFRDAGYFNPDYSSATSDDISLALAQGDTAFSFLMNFVAVTGYTYNPDANIGFMPVPAFEGGEPYLISGEKNALGIHKDSEYVDAAKAFIAFLAEPANLQRLAESVGSAAGLTTVTVDLGGLTDSFELTKSTATVPYFDRVYMPNGSWDSIVSTTEGVLTNQLSIEESLAKIEEDFDALYAQQAE
ncbi:MAG: extracellular solute-binding protein [Chloroflexota bacterium]